MIRNKWILAVMGLLLASPASAFDLVNTLPAADVWLQLLQQLAPVGPVPAPPAGMEAPWQAPLIQAFTVFNTSLLVVAGMILAWHTIIGTVASAQEGKTLGSKWHTIWAPLRVTTGIAFLAPLASGFGAAQLLVIQLAVWGGGLANDVWSGYVKFFGDKETITQSFRRERTADSAKQDTKFALERMQQASGAQTMFLRILEKQVCVQSQKLLYDVAMRDYNTAVEGYSRPLNWDILASGTMTPSERNMFNGKFGSDQRAWYNFWSSFEPAVADDNTIRQHSIDVLRNGHPIGKVVDKNPSVSAQAAEAEGLTAFLPDPHPILVYDFGPLCGRVIFDIASDNVIAKHREAMKDFVSGQNSGGWSETLLSADIAMTEADYDKYFARITELTQKFKDGSQSGKPSSDFSGMDPIIADLSRVAGLVISAAEDPEKLKLLKPNGAADQLLANANVKYARLLKEIGVEYETTVAEWARDYNIDTMLKRLAEQGWASAGTFYMVVAKLQSMIAQPLDVAVTMTKPDWSQFKQLHPIMTDKVFGERSIHSLMQEYQRRAATNTGDGEVDKFIAAMQSDSGNVFSDAASYLAKYVSLDIINVLNWLKIDPHSAMLDVVDMGHTLINIGGTGIAVTVGAQAASGVGTGIPLVGGVLEGLAKPATALIAAAQVGFFLLTAVGAIHAYVLPMLPYIMMLFAVLGMIILVAEALVAAPLWALFHVRMDGQDFVDQSQKPGYMIAFNLFLRPVLTVFGLILSFGVFGSMVWFTNLTFNTAGKSLMSGSGDLLGLAVMVAILTYLHYQICIRSFTLINQVPDRVVRWFGQGGENLGEQSDAEGATNVIMGGTSRKIEGSVKYAAATGSAPKAGAEGGKAEGKAKASKSVAEPTSRPPSANGH